jgi:glutathione S-transferase
MRLYDYAASANCLKVRLALGLLGLDYERVPVDIFAAREELAALNPARRTPVLELEPGAAIAESNAILLYLAEDTELLPGGRLERARVHQWLFFEQNLLEPNVGTARFWRLTGSDGERPDVFERHLEAGAAALESLARGLADKRFLVGDRLTVADLALYAYTHVAHEAGLDATAIAGWLTRMHELVGPLNDLEPYPENARAGWRTQTLGS